MAVAAVADRLTADVPADGRTPISRHDGCSPSSSPGIGVRRKSSWWLFFHLKDELTDPERIEAPEPLSGLEYAGVVEEDDKALVHQYRFPTQEYDVKVGSSVVDPNTWGVPDAARNPGEIVALDEAAHTINLRRTRRNMAPIRPPSSRSTITALPNRRTHSSASGNGSPSRLAAEGPHRAALDLLVGRAPRSVRSPAPAPEPGGT